MKLIDENALEAKLEEQRKLYIEMDMKGAEHLLVHDVLHHVWEAPTIDAVPVVRCRDCKHCNTDWAMGKWYGSCKEWNTHSVMADWYCVNGERKDNE